MIGSLSSAPDHFSRPPSFAAVLCRPRREHPHPAGLEVLAGTQASSALRAILVWDRWNVHRSAARQIAQGHPDWFDFEWLPAYAPELNPVEHVWNHTKYGDLANFIPDNLLHLNVALHWSLIGKERNQIALQSCFHGAKLSL